MQAPPTRSARRCGLPSGSDVFAKAELARQEAAWKRKLKWAEKAHIETMRMLQQDDMADSGMSAEEFNAAVEAQASPWTTNGKKKPQPPSSPRPKSARPATPTTTTVQIPPRLLAIWASRPDCYRQGYQQGYQKSYAEFSREVERIEQAHVRVHGEMSSELFKEREAQRELRQTRQTFATLHHSKEMSDMCYELSKEHAAQRELSQKLDALHRVKEMTDLALQSERHEHERTRARLDAVERVVLQANELANQLDRERQMHEATALDLANVLARERSVHDTMRQQLSQQQLDLQSAETQAARESTTQQRQLSERLGTCEAALARRDERINELERAKYELSLQLDVAQLAQRDATAQLDTALLTRRELETELEATQRGDIEAIASQFAAVRQRNSELEAELRLATKELQAARQRNSMLLLTSQLKPKR